ncbi:MAG: hypothetical protein ACM3OO_11065 [Planctomycetaceae bacterium]
MDRICIGGVMLDVHAASGALASGGDDLAGGLVAVALPERGIDTASEPLPGENSRAAAACGQVRVLAEGFSGKAAPQFLLVSLTEEAEGRWLEANLALEVDTRVTGADAVELPGGA